MPPAVAELPPTKPKAPRREPPPEPPRFPPPGPLGPIARMIVEDALIGEAEIVPITVDVYDLLIEHGMTDKTIELLDGLLVRKINDSRSHDGEAMGEGVTHMFSIDAVTDLNPQVKLRGGFVRTQHPIRMSDRSEPEPDAAIVRGSYKDYRDRKPEPRDVSCVIEVMRTSHRRDRRSKRAAYARDAVPQYVRIDLAEKAVEVDEEPDAKGRTFGRSYTVDVDGTVPLLMPDGSRLDVPAEDLLP